MAKRLNPRQEKFVREYVKTGNGRKSYEKAYGVSAAVNANAVDASASALLSSPKVAPVIAAVRARALSRHDVTVDTILNDLEEDRAFARSCEQAGAAVSATTTKARLLGMIVDRKETGAPGEFAALDTVKAILEAARKELGNEAVIALARLVGEPVTIDATPETSDGDE
jgi:phage terminase small subunit